METLDALIELAMIVEKSKTAEDSKQQDPIVRIHRQLAKGEVLIEIYAMIERVKENG